MYVLRALCQLTIACVLSVAGFAKLLNFRATEEAFVEFGYRRFSRELTLLIPASELILSSCLLFGRAKRFAAVGTSVMFAMFTFITIKSFQGGSRHECNCFGSLFRTRVGPTMIARNLLLMGISVALAYFKPRDSPFFDVCEIFSHRSAVKVSKSFPLFISRIFKVQQMLCFVGIASLLSLSILKQSRGNVSKHGGLKTGASVPNLIVTVRDGTPTAWSEIRNLNQETCIIFVSATCASCRQLVKQIDESATSLRTLPIILVAGGTPAIPAFNAVNITKIYAQEQAEILTMFGARTVPAAVVISRENKIVSELMYGLPEIADYVRKLAAA